jgi:hypothetical protein
MLAMAISHPVVRITSCDDRRQPSSVAPLGRRWFLALSALLLFKALQTCAVAQVSGGPASPDQVALITRATERELHALENPAPFQFQERIEWSWGAETRSVIETVEGRADRVVLFRDAPLSPEQQAKQKHRMEKLLSDRDAAKRELQDQEAEARRRIRMVKAFPKAFFFDFAGRKNGLLHFEFYPNPDFSPKDRETQMYRGMEGTLWVEPVQERIIQIDGKLVKDVSFGWGVFGRLSKGGIYKIAQAQLSPGTWRITTLNVEVKGRIFLFDSFRYVRRETNTRFRPISAIMSYRAAVQALLTGDPGPKDDKTGSPSGSAPTHMDRRPEKQAAMRMLPESHR